MILTCAKITLLAVLQAHFAETISGPITTDFQTWLLNNGYDSIADDFARLDLNLYGSFGGRETVNDQIQNQPVVFIHGAGDTALASSNVPMQTGWTSAIDQFLKAGYIFAELYGTTWGDGIYANAPKQQMDCPMVIRTRRFIEAVLEYTKSAKIDVIAHSTGVAIARKALKGGVVSAYNGTCNIGLPINHFVDTFLGLAGENYGVCNCLAESGTFNKNEPICNNVSGLFPGNSCLSSRNCGQVAEPCEASAYSTFLQELNENTAIEADYMFAFWTFADNVIGYNGTVWGQTTSRFPGASAIKEYQDYNHTALKDLTGRDQVAAVRDHIVKCDSHCSSAYLIVLERQYLSLCLLITFYFSRTMVH